MFTSYKVSGNPQYFLPLCWTGFLSVRDAIESLRQIGDIKSRLDKEKLQKDIRHICSKVAELNDLWHYQLKSSFFLRLHLSWSDSLCQALFKPEGMPVGDIVDCFLTSSIPILLCEPTSYLDCSHIEFSPPLRRKEIVLQFEVFCEFLKKK